MDPRLLQPSGLNSQFHGHGLDFTDYMVETREMIKNARIDITPDNEAAIINANSPYELCPATKPKRGVLLIHGLYDSPYSLQDLGKQFYANDFLVRSILLPGHGTRPGDMLNISYREWVKAVDYGIAETQKLVDEFYVVGFSLGAAFAISQTRLNPAVKATILFAPAFETIIPYAKFADWHYLFSWMSAKFKWYQQAPQNSYAKYESYCFNAANQARRIMRNVYYEQKSYGTEIPNMIVATETDESVSMDATLAVFKRNANPKNQLLLYSGNGTTYGDKRISLRKSFYPEHNILDFSHICLPISPENRHYGKLGDYHEFIQNDKPTPASSDIFFGAINPKREDNPEKLIRLTYNPDFEFMTKAIFNFIEGL